MALAARDKGVVDAATDRLAVKALFTTLTNVSLIPKPCLTGCTVCWPLAMLWRNALAIRPMPTGPIAGSRILPLAIPCPWWMPPPRIAWTATRIVSPLRQTLLYGLKGVAAYADHAAILGQEDGDLYADIYRGMAAGFDGKPRDLNAWVAAVLDSGRSALRSMELLDAANTGAYGHPEPTQVPLGPKAGKAILVSGHDLKDLYTLLAATEGKGVNIYTHGEMLSAHAYPGSKNIPISSGISARPGRTSTKNFRPFPALFCSPPTVFSSPSPATRPTCLPPVSCPGPA